MALMVALESISVTLIFPLFQNREAITEFFNSIVHTNTQVSFTTVVIVTIVVAYIIKSSVTLLLFRFQIRRLYEFQNYLSHILISNTERKSFKSGLSIEDRSNLVRDSVLELGKLTHGWLIPIIVISSEIIIFAFFIVIILLVQGSLVLKLIPIMIVVTFCYIYFITPYLESLGRTRVKMDQKRVENLQDYLNSLQEFKNYHRENPILKNYQANTSTSFSADANIVVLQYVPKLVIEILVIIMIGMAINNSSINDSGSDDLINYAVAGLAGLRLLPSVNKIINMVQSLRAHSYLVSDLSIKLTDNPYTLKKRKSFSGQKVHVKSLRFKNQNRTVSIPDFELSRGTITTLIGSSGVGKSSVIQAIVGNAFNINGFFEMDGKKYNFNDYCLEGWICPQKPHIFKDTLVKNIDPFDNAEENIGELNFIKDVDCDDNNIIEQERLSGGQVQRIGILRAINSGMDFLIFDEPTNNLDATNRADFLILLEKLKIENKAILLVTHDQHLTAKADKILRLE